MTTERWTDEMLDRFASTTTRLITNLTALSEKNTLDISRLESSVERLADITGIHQQALEMNQRSLEAHQRSLEAHQQSLVTHQQQFNTVMSEIREMQAEMRGLQTENRRILDQLINRDDENG